MYRSPTVENKNNKIYPGDAVIFTCYHNTQGMIGDFIHGGESTSDEMCFVVIGVYPWGKDDL